MIVRRIYVSVRKVTVRKRERTGQFLTGSNKFGVLEAILRNFLQEDLFGFAVADADIQPPPRLGHRHPLKVVIAIGRRLRCID